MGMNVMKREKSLPVGMKGAYRNRHKGHGDDGSGHWTVGASTRHRETMGRETI